MRRRSARPPLPALPSATERQEQRAVVDYLRLALPPGSIVHHSANETAVDPSRSARAKAAYFEGRRLDGVVDGFPDLTLLLPEARTFLIEMKRPGGGRLSKEQRDLHPEIRALGHSVEVAHTVEEVRDILLAAGVPLREVRL